MNQLLLERRGERDGAGVGARQQLAAGLHDGQPRELRQQLGRGCRRQRHVGLRRSRERRAEAALLACAEPALYCWVFSDAFPALEPVQRVLGCLVAGREALFLVSVLACTWVNPAFLLVDVGASVRDETVAGTDGGYGFLFMYVVAPEKLLVGALFEGGGLDKQGLVFVAMLGGVLLDFCGVAALGAGVGVGNLPPALAVGYSVTALGALFLVGFVLVVWPSRRGRGCVARCAAGVPGAARALPAGGVIKA